MVVVRAAHTFAWTLYIVVDVVACNLVTSRMSPSWEFTLLSGSGVQDELLQFSFPLKCATSSFDAESAAAAW